MAPKKKNKEGSTSAQKKEIDPGNIPISQHFSLDLGLDDGLLKYFFTGIIWYWRCLVILNGIRLNNKPVTTLSDDHLLIALVYGNHKTKILIAKSNLYVTAVMCAGEWRYPSDSKYTVKGGREIGFPEGYPPDRIFKVGVEVLRTAVSDLHRQNSERWRDAYYNLATNFCECTRFISIHLQFLRFSSSQLGDLDDWLVNNWGTVSKLWKFFCRYGVWNPLAVLTKVDDPTIAEKVLAIVVNVDIDSDILGLDKRFPVADKSVR